MTVALISLIAAGEWGAPSHFSYALKCRDRAVAHPSGCLDLDARLADARALGLAYAAALTPGARVAVGYDGRLSSPALEAALVDGLATGGFQVERIGLGPTGMLYFAVHDRGLDGGITRVAEVPSRSLLSRLTDHYLQIIANRAPIGFEAEFVGTRGRTTMYRGILMPFSSNGDAIDFVVRREIFKHLERIVDAFEDVANVIDGIVIDHS